VSWDIECRECHTVSSHGWSHRTTAELAVKNLRRAGWEVEYGKKPLCGDCRKRHRAGANVVKMFDAEAVEVDEMVGAVVTLKEEPASRPSGPDLKIARRIYSTLDEHFDESIKRYREGWSDRAVAEALDVSVEIVTRIRKEAYGEIAEDPRIKEMREEVEMIALGVAEVLELTQTRCDELQKQIVALGERMTKLFVKPV
jgi:ribosome-binding protein aMBF1 (putative translation factor)